MQRSSLRMVGSGQSAFAMLLIAFCTMYPSDIYTRHSYLYHLDPDPESK